MAETGNQSGKRMWSSFHTPAGRFSVSNGLIIVGAALTGAATISGVWLANVRAYLKRDLTDTSARIEEARTAAADAVARTAEADQKAEEVLLAQKSKRDLRPGDYNRL